MLCVLTHEPFDCHVNGGRCAGYVEALQAFGPKEPNPMAQDVAALFEGCFQLALSEDRARMSPEERARAERIARGQERS